MIDIMSGSDKTAVIVVNFNGGDFLDRCLTSLECQTFSGFKTFVLDNASEDGSIDGLEQRFPEIEIIRLERNIGFAAANNRVVRQAEGYDWVALLNPDAFADPDWLANLHRVAKENPNHSFFGSHMRRHDSSGLLDGTGDVYHVSGLAWRRDHGMPEDRIPRATGEIFSPCAAAAMYRRDVFLEAGGFDERFFCYFEDIDLAFRLRLLGHRCLHVSDAAVEHIGSATTGRQSDFAVYHGHRNMVWAYAKNMPASMLSLPQHILANLAALVYFSLRGQAAPIFKAKWDALAGLGTALVQRRKLQKEIKISLPDLKAIIAQGWFLPYFKNRR